MNVQEAIAKRYSVRSYEPREVESEKLTAVLEAARLAPSGNNRQAWKFVVVRDADLRGKLVAACGNQKFVGQAPVVIACVGLTPDGVMQCGVPRDPVNLAIAIDHMTLAAVELGLGTCWIGAFDQDAVRDVLGIPTDVRVIEVLTLGYPADSLQPKSRKSLDEIVCWEQWS